MLKYINTPDKIMLNFNSMVVFLFLTLTPPVFGNDYLSGPLKVEINGNQDLSLNILGTSDTTVPYSWHAGFYSSTLLGFCGHDPHNPTLQLPSCDNNTRADITYVISIPENAFTITSDLGDHRLNFNWDAQPKETTLHGNCYVISITQQTAIPNEMYMHCDYDKPFINYSLIYIPSPHVISVEYANATFKIFPDSAMLNYALNITYDSYRDPTSSNMDIEMTSVKSFQVYCTLTINGVNYINSTFPVHFSTSKIGTSGTAHASLLPEPLSVVFYSSKTTEATMKLNNATSSASKGESILLSYNGEQVNHQRNPIFQFTIDNATITSSCDDSSVNLSFTPDGYGLWSLYADGWGHNAVDTLCAITVILPYE